MTEVSANLLQSENESYKYGNRSFLYSDGMCNVRNSMSQKNNESKDKSYGDDSSNEICVFKLNQEKIDELANDYRLKTCVSSSRECPIQEKSHKGRAKNDGIFSRNEDEFRCKSNRKRKAHRKMSEGIIIDLGNDAYGTFRNGIKISVISMHNLVSEMRFITIPKKRASCSIWNRNRRKKIMKKKINNLTLTVPCFENCIKMKRIRKPRCKYKNYLSRSLNNLPRKDTDRTVKTSRKIENILSEEQKRIENNIQPLHASNEILDSTKCCHHDDTPVAIDNVRYPILSTEQTYVDARKCIANYCYSIFNDKHQEYHICDREDYNVDSSDFNAEMQTDWTTERFHPEYTRAKGCRCFYDLNEYDPDINMQRDRCPPMSQTVRSFGNSAFSKKHQREEIVRFGLNELDIPAEFATEVDEYSDKVERCANCVERKRSSPSIRKRVTSETNVFAEVGNVVDLHDSRITDTSRCEVDTQHGKCGWRTTTTTIQKPGDRSYKSDSLKDADTWDVRARRDDCIGRHCVECVAAEPSRFDQRPREKGEFIHEVDSKWKWDSIETDAQQLDRKWKRRVATVHADTSAGMRFKGKRDCRSRARVTNDEINDDNTQQRARDFFWTLQMNKIWLQVHDAWKNVAKLVATSIGRVKDEPKSKCSQGNPSKVSDKMLKNLSSYTDKICCETCCKNLMLLKNTKKPNAHQESTIEDVRKYHEDMEVSMWKNPRTIFYHDVQKFAYQNAGKEIIKKPCVIYNGTIKYERDRYQDIVELQDEICNYNEDIHFQPHLNEENESVLNLDNSTYPRFRSRGGSDNQNLTKDILNKSMRYEEESSTRQRLAMRKPPNRINEETETYKDSEEIDVEIEIISNNLDATTSLTNVNSMIHSSRNDSNEPAASTSKSSPVSPEKSRRNRSRFLFCVPLKLRKRRSSADDETIVPLLKRNREGIGKNELSSTAGDNESKITQMEPSAVQTAQEGNKRRAYINIQVQTPDAIVTRILSELLLNGEKKRRVLMNMKLQSVSEKKEMETQTSSNSLTSTDINSFDCQNKCSQNEIAISSNTVRCSACDEQDYYKIKQSDDSITLEEELITECPETSELNNCLAKKC